MSDLSTVALGNELVGEGICDFCGEYVKELLALKPNKRAAGFCACEKCSGSDWPNAKIMHKVSK